MSPEAASRRSGLTLLTRPAAGEEDLPSREETGIHEVQMACLMLNDILVDVHPMVIFGSCFFIIVGIGEARR